MKTSHLGSGAQAGDLPVPLNIDRSWLDNLESRLDKGGPWGDFRLFQLAVQGEEARLVTSFDELQCVKHLQDLSPLPHQIDTARRVLFEMSGRAILADEVGLGKTIEAGLILKEYMVRGLVSKVLILVPASLVLQWVRELNSKFGIPAVAQKKAYSWHSDVVVASMDTAKREPHKDMLMEQEYDMLIIDEAHKLKNKKTTNYQFIQKLRKKYCLLLTATPVQNDMSELFNLITLLKPGQLGRQGDFAANFVVGKRQAKNEDQLRDELAKVMIRNRRGEGPVQFTKRTVRNVSLQLSPEEQALYDGVTSFVKNQYKASGGNLSSMLSLVTLQREVCSSRDAVFLTLVNLSKKIPDDSPLTAEVWELVNAIRNIKANTKAEKTIELIKDMNEKVIVFTEYRATQEYLLQYFQKHGLSCVPYRGGMNRGKKDWMMDLFRGRAQVMIATEAGGEGINLQFCHHMINFDLPWNPMRVEQRIGRVHRLGQQNDVKIYNLSTTGTIEEHILNLLHEKINMFETVIGGLDVILERFEKKESFEKSLYKLFLESESDEEIRNKVSSLGQSLDQIKREIEYEDAETVIEEEA
ncbi:DEAD/DEAH box helicase [Paenibacillus sp. VMFN-D1]|uniref:DEAD/DEAH box helicase n=1 Tax=Paenibacillus sp. VMFN-D1 TaxID=2135608 RepID=UPI000E36EC4E|nr:helicase-like protein [Paenibacillus sp. VMFN-D1]